MVKAPTKYREPFGTVNQIRLNICEFGESISLGESLLQQFKSRQNIISLKF